ncbi:MAG TPA: hypothetical protein VE467_01655 [Chryseolinea sp.]|nr:hypothetical protein [Chryseolinea sp.]
MICKIYKPSPILFAQDPSLFLVDIFTTESQSHGELDGISYEAHVDHGLAVLCGLVWVHLPA